MNVPCPECLFSPCEEICREVIEEGLQRTFECSDCGHVWNVVF